MGLLFRLRWQIVKKYNQSYWASLTLISCANEVKVQHFNQIPEERNVIFESSCILILIYVWSKHEVIKAKESCAYMPVLLNSRNPLSSSLCHYR